MSSGFPVFQSHHDSIINLKIGKNNVETSMFQSHYDSIINCLFSLSPGNGRQVSIPPWFDYKPSRWRCTSFDGFSVSIPPWFDYKHCRDHRGDRVREKFQSHHDSIINLLYLQKQLACVSVSIPPWFDYKHLFLFFFGFAVSSFNPTMIRL